MNRLTFIRSLLLAPFAAKALLRAVPAPQKWWRKLGPHTYELTHLEEIPLGRRGMFEAAVSRHVGRYSDEEFEGHLDRLGREFFVGM